MRLLDEASGSDGQAFRFVPVEGRSPYFSIVIPTYNRPLLTTRAVRSVLDDKSDVRVEVIVVDDGSDDDTLDRVSEMRARDTRVIALTTGTNSGVSAARNLGIKNARAPWILMLDSDCRLLPGALTYLASATATVPEDVGNMATRCLWDTGLITPTTPPPTRFLGYEEFLSWIDQVDVSEWFNCFRADVFRDLRYPEGAYEGGLHLDVAQNWRFGFDDRCSIIFGTDAPRRVTSDSISRYAGRAVSTSSSMRQEAERILRAHGDALANHAPRVKAELLVSIAQFSFLDGKRMDGLRYSALALAERRSSRGFAGALLGLCGPRALSLAMATWRLRTLRALASRTSSCQHVDQELP